MRVLFSVPSNLSAVIFHGSSVTGSQFTIYQTQFVKELEFCTKANRRVGLIKLLDASQGDPENSFSASCREGGGVGGGGGWRVSRYFSVCKILVYCTKDHFIHTNLQR